MLSIDAAAITARRLGSLPYPQIVYPNLYGIGTVKDFNWYAVNYPAGFIAIAPPRALGAQGVMAAWAVTVDAAAKDEPAAALVARAIQARLLSLPRSPTGFEFLGDGWAGQSGDGFKYVLTFMAHLRQGE